MECGDRGEAITRLIAELEPADLMLIAGKGHEQVQQTASDTIPFDDRAFVRLVLADSP